MATYEIIYTPFGDENARREVIFCDRVAWHSENAVSFWGGNSGNKILLILNPKYTRSIRRLRGRR